VALRLGSEGPFQAIGGDRDFPLGAINSIYRESGAVILAAT
jgi:hypothetical protein